MPKKNSVKKLHKIPKDLQDKLTPKLLVIWQTLTPLSRNEWICWVTMAKKEETRKLRLSRMSEELLQGKRRPCCWPGCPHRRPTALKWFSKKRINSKEAD